MSQYSVGLISLAATELYVRADYDCPISGYSGTPGWTRGDTLNGSNGSTWRVVTTYAGGATGTARIARLTGALVGSGMTLTRTGGATATVSATPSKLADWLGNVTVTSVGPLFSPGASNWFGVVASIDSLGDILTLDRSWPLTSIWESDYIIHTSFSPIAGVPLIGQGDYRTAAIVNRAVTQLDQLAARVTKTINATYTVGRNDHAMVLLVSAASALSINLPTAASVGNGWYFEILPWSNAGGITVVRQGAELINGGGNYSIAPGSTYQTGFRRIMTDGANWYAV